MLLRYLVAVIALVATTITATAGIHGILTGRVTDKEKKAVSGATIRVLGTTRGAISKTDGKYNVVNIVAGTYDVRVTAVGFDTVTKKVTISADQTVNLDFTMTVGGGTLADTIFVDAQKEMVRKDALGTTRTMRGEDLTRMARDNVASAISLNPGIVASGNGFQVRGSRTTETQVLVDGLQVTDVFTGGLGNSGATVSAAMPSNFATEEVQSQTGGGGAEYGNALGGQVNTVVKTGRTTGYEGLLRWRKDVPFAFGESGNGYQMGSPLEDVVDVTFGGPLGFSTSTFFIAVRNTYQNHRNFDLKVQDKIGNDLGMQPNNRTWSRNLTGRIKLGISDDMFLLLGGMYGMVNGERNSWGWLYANTPGITVDADGNPILDGNGNVQSNGIPERNAKQIVVEEYSSNAFAQFNHTLDNNTFYEVRYSWNDKLTQTARRKTFDAPGILSGFDVYMPEDNYKIEGDRIVKVGEDERGDQILDQYTLVRPVRTTEDGLARYETSVPNELTGYVEGAGDAQVAWANPYGLQGYFVGRGNEGGVDFRHAVFHQVDGNITSKIETGDNSSHLIKAGFEFRLMELNRHSNGNPWDGQPFYDFYGNEFGDNYYVSIDPTQPWTADAYNNSLKAYKPVTAGLFVQDQIFFKSLVFTPGLRVDYLDANSLYRTQYDPFVPFGYPTGFATVEAKLYFSPRLSVTYPITERQNINLSYGIYYQAPPFAEFYDSFNNVILRGNNVLGNPNMEMQRSNQYQVSYNQQLTDELAFTVTGFYKDIYNQSGLAFVRVTPDPYYQRVLSDYGTSRGIELTLQKRVTNNWGFNLNYTLMSARGTANDANTAVGLDPVTGEPAFPVTDFPLSFDRRHRINANITLQWGDDQGPSIAGAHFLEFFTVNLSGFWQTGLPYTPVNLRGQATAGINSARQPSNWFSEMRINRTIPLGGFLGPNTALDIFLDVFNLLNYTGAVAFYPATGSPDYDGIGLNRVPGDFASTAYYKKGEKWRPETFAPAQYDRTGKRQYNSLVDYNNDGIMTQDEVYRGYQEYVSTVVARRANYQDPRSVYFGIGFRF
jgi:outer membrane receptor protein involved in Fe transport